MSVALAAVLAPVALLSGAGGAGAQAAPVRAATAAPSVDWTVDLSTLTIFDIQGKIDTDLCADVYGTVTVERGGEKHVLWQRARGKTLAVCEPNRPLGEGEQSGVQSLDIESHFSSKASDTRPWKITADLKDADPGGSDDAVLTAGETLRVTRDNQGYLQNDYPNRRTRASLAYEITPETCGRTAADYEGRTFKGRLFAGGDGTMATMEYRRGGVFQVRVGGRPFPQGRWEVVSPSKKIEGKLHPVKVTNRGGKTIDIIPTCTYDPKSNSPKVTTTTTVRTHPNGYVSERIAYTLEAKQ
ncbi:hypothetical protein [Streptomyces sp. NPDC006645]